MAVRKIAATPDPDLGFPLQIFRRIVDTVPHMLWTARPDGTLDYVNAHTTNYTGLTFEQTRVRWREVVHPDDVDLCVSRWENALRTGMDFEAEYRLRRADGEYRWHAHSIMAMRDATGAIQLWYGTCTDIDDRKRSVQRLDQARAALESLVAARTQALDESAQRLRAFLDSMPAIAWIKDAQRRYVWVSESYERLLGKSLAQIRGRENHEIWPEDMARLHRRLDEAAMRGNGPVQSINRVPRSDGSVLRLLIVKFPLLDENGQMGVAGIGFDLGGDELVLDPREDVAERLSARELQVLRLTVDGLTSAEIAHRLQLSPKSVETYRSRMMAKLAIDDLPSLVKFAIRQGLTSAR